MNILERLHRTGIVPVAVIENADNAVPAAQALLAGGIDVMEITFRTAQAPEAILRVANSCSDMVVGAGTVTTIEQCRQAVELGAKFIVSPGFNRRVVEWCCEQGIPVTPGCVTPTEIMMALEMGINVVKFFPANIYGGISAMKALSAPFGGVKFIPTGGVNTQNISEYMREPFVHAVGGSWICPKSDITAGNFDHITALCVEAKKAMKANNLLAQTELQRFSKIGGDKNEGINLW